MSDNFTGATTSHCLPLRPGAKHVYIEGNTQERVTLDVRSVGPNEVSLDVKLPNGMNAAFQIRSDRPPNSNLDTSRLWITKADTGSGIALTFGPGGLALPMNLVVGETITAQPNEQNPATGGQMVITFHVDAVEKVKVRPQLALDQEAGFLVHQVVKSTVVVKDTNLGTVLARFELWLLPGLGLVKSAGQAFGVFTILDLIEFHTPA